jgi:hypothetical protein
VKLRAMIWFEAESISDPRRGGRARRRRPTPRAVDFEAPNQYPCRAASPRASIRFAVGRRDRRGDPVGSVIKKRRKKMRKHKKRKLLRRARHKRKK